MWLIVISCQFDLLLFISLLLSILLDILLLGDPANSILHENKINNEAILDLIMLEKSFVHL